MGFTQDAVGVTLPANSVQIEKFYLHKWRIAFRGKFVLFETPVLGVVRRYDTRFNN